MSWPRTEADKEDEKWFAELPDFLPPDYAAYWERHEICGCGDYLESDEERRDGVCEICLWTGTRTPRAKEGDK